MGPHKPQGIAGALERFLMAYASSTQASGDALVMHRSLTVAALIIL